MNLRVLGRYGPYPRAEGACSGCLLSAGERNIVLDLGAGTLPRLLSVCDANALTAVVLSHLHFDHCGDMAILRYLLEQKPRAPLPVYCPDGPESPLSIFRSPVFELHALTDGAHETIAGLSAVFTAAAHPVPAYSVRISDGQSTLFYTGDTGWIDALPAYAQGADAILANTCFTDADVNKPNVHLRARQAGALAKAAGAKLLLCSHLWGGADTESAVQKEVDFTPSVVVQERGLYCF